jgi:hypothetical protein
MGIHSVTGEPFIWAAAILPVVAVFVPMNLSWGIAILISRQWKSGRYTTYWLVVIVLWLVALAIDFAHH